MEGADPSAGEVRLSEAFRVNSPGNLVNHVLPLRAKDAVPLFWAGRRHPVPAADRPRRSGAAFVGGRAGACRGPMGWPPTRVHRQRRDGRSARLGHGLGLQRVVAAGAVLLWHGLAASTVILLGLAGVSKPPSLVLNHPRLGGRLWRSLRPPGTAEPLTTKGAPAGAPFGWSVRTLAMGPPGPDKVYPLNARTTFEKRFLTWPPIVMRIMMAAIDTMIRISAYSTSPCPFWSAGRLSSSR